MNEKFGVEPLAKKKWQKWVILALAVLCTVLLLAVLLRGCGPWAHNEVQIARDMADFGHFEYHESNGTLSNHELVQGRIRIDKRQTNKEAGTDYVWITLTGQISPKYASQYGMPLGELISNSYKLTYILYNDGWHLEDYDKIKSW